MAFYDHWQNPTALQEQIDKIQSKPQVLILAIANQFDIGCSLFPLGIIASEFGTAFETLWDPYQGKQKYTPIQWNKKLIRNCLDNFRELWKIRCTIQNDENKDTLETTYRTELQTLHNQMREQWWKFSSTDRKLVSQPATFFETSPISSLQVWYRQLNVAMAASQFQASSNTPDLRTYFPVSQQAQRPRPDHTQTRLIPTQVLYRQKKLIQGPFSQAVTPATQKISSQRRFTKINPITHWMVKKSNRRRISSPVQYNKFSSNFSINKIVDVGSRLAVCTEPTRKIKNLIN